MFFSCQTGCHFINYQGNTSSITDQHKIAKQGQMLSVKMKKEALHGKYVRDLHKTDTTVALSNEPNPGLLAPSLRNYITVCVHMIYC